MENGNGWPMPVVITTLLSPFFSLAEASSFLGGPLQGYVNYLWVPRAFQNLDPNDNGLRLFYIKQEAGAGLRITRSGALRSG